MNRQQIRPTLGDLADYDEAAFPELLNGQLPSATVTRLKPPTLISTSSTSPQSYPSPKPIIDSSIPLNSKPKSRFALQREREAAERAAALAASKGSERFTLNLDDDEGEEELPLTPQLVGQVIERESDNSIPLPPSFASSGQSVASPVAVHRSNNTNGFPTSFRLQPTLKVEKELQTQSEVKAEESIKDELPSMLSSISKESDNVLSGLTQREILEEQKQIRENMGLSESVIKMLEERGRKKGIMAATSTKKSLVRPTVASVVKPIVKPLEEEEEGTPEYIRRHFFPNEPTVNSSLDWMRDPATSTSNSTLDEGDLSALPTFDLNGEPLSLESTSSNSTSSSSSHHVSSSSAFTIPSLLSLTTSAVSSQRSTSLSVLLRILSRGQNETLLGKKVWVTLRLDAGKSSSWAIRDPNLGVSTAAMALLHYLFSSELDLFLSSTAITNDNQLPPGAEVPQTLISVFLSTDPYPILSRQLSISSLPPSTHISILQILNAVLRLSSKGQPMSLAVEELIASPSLLDMVAKRFISVPWPLLNSSYSLPLVSALQFFTDIAKSSRARAKILWDKKLVESGLRFLAILPWDIEDAESRTLGYQLLEQLLEFWEVEARYGIATSLRTRIASLLDSLLSKFSTFFLSTQISPEDIKLIQATFRLLEIWTIAAIDPHTTSHDILWTQVEEWNYLALKAHEWVLNNVTQQEEAELGLLETSWNLLSAWLEGSKINKGWKGEEERKWIASSIGKDFIQGSGRVDIIVCKALKRLGNGKGLTSLDESARMISAALRLSNAYQEDSNPITLALLVLDPSLLAPIFDIYFIHDSTSLVITKVLVDLLYYLPSIPLQLSATVKVLNLLQIDDESTIQTLITWLFDTLSNSNNHQYLSHILDPTLEIPAFQKLSNLNPFINFAIKTIIGGKSISPLHPSVKDLVKSTSMYPFASTSPILSSNWPLTTLLDELLRSGTSPVFENLPKDWEGSELELVKSSLVLMRVVEICGSREGQKSCTNGTVLIYDLIKIFMLEKDNTTSGTISGAKDSDLFRDTSIEYSMSQLLLPSTISQLSFDQIRSNNSVGSEINNLEKVHSQVSSAPFYRLYTDLIGLFDSISMSHTLFSQILLPPLSMSYPIDFRKLFWIDYSQILSTIKLSIKQTITDSPSSNSLSQYLYPVEKDLNILIAYGEILVSGLIKLERNELLYFIALHHLSSCLLSNTDNFGAVEKVQIKKLAKAIVEQGGNDLVENLLSYEQVEQEGERLRLIPECFVKEGEKRKNREASLKGLLE